MGVLNYDSFFNPFRTYFISWQNQILRRVSPALIRVIAIMVFLADAVPTDIPSFFASQPFPHFIYVPNFIFHLRMQAGERFYACRHLLI